MRRVFTRSPGFILPLPFFLLSLFALSAASTLPAETASAGIDSPEHWKPGYERLSRMGRGFVVWESKRTGRWRIWRIDLDGTGLRQLSPEEEGHDHFAPHISPDGTRLTYLSVPDGADQSAPASGNSPKLRLHLLSADGRFDRVIVADARSYGGDRAVVWMNRDELIYIDANRMTRRMHLAEGKNEPLLAEPAKADEWGFGWLMEPTLRFATTGRPAFSPFDAGSRTVKPRAAQEGCEPYFSRDGVWGYWMGGAGGPINRFRLETSEISPILAKDDPRMPAERRYLYFPMLSNCGRLFTFAASPNQHDHDTSDYDVFVAPIDSVTLELTGNPVRYTFDASCDRYPDVYLAGFDLGDFRGEAPLKAEFKASPASGSWRWSVGESEAGASGPSFSRTFDAPGEYEVSARQGNRLLRGRVRVTAAKPPVVRMAVLQSPKEIRVVFDEPVRLVKPAFRLATRASVERWTLEEENRTLRLLLKAPSRDGDILFLDGVEDRAQIPNRMTVTHWKVAGLQWPANRNGLVFLWETGNRSNRVGSGAGEWLCAVQPRGRAHYNHDYSMALAGGSYTAKESGEAITAACVKSNRLTIEATIQPDRESQNGPARIVSLSTDALTRNFTLGQEDQSLIIRLRTPSTGVNGVEPQVTLFPLSVEEPTHVVVTYTPGQLVCYRNGRETFRTDRVKGDFSNWTAQPLVFGDEWNGERNWAGRLEGVAIYDRILTPEEVAAHSRDYRLVREGRGVVPRVRVEATLSACSKIPTLKEIQPYREALALYEYRVEKWAGMAAGAKGADGFVAPKTVRVAHWVLLNGESLPAAGWTAGRKVTLDLEPFDRNPQLSSRYLSDTLPENWDARPYFSVNDRD